MRSRLTAALYEKAGYTHLTARSAEQYVALALDAAPRGDGHQCVCGAV